MICDTLPTCLAGTLLLALPSITGRAFHRSVVFIFAHDTGGAAGVVVNRPAGRASVRKFLQDADRPVPPGLRGTVHFGGPVDRDGAILLHSAEGSGTEGTIETTAGVNLTAAECGLDLLTGDDRPREWLLLRGHAGWGPGQIEREIGSGAWLTLPASRGLVFGGPPATRWARAMRRLGVAPERLSAQSGRA